MKNVSTEMSTEALVAVAIIFSLETAGVSNDELVAGINAKIDDINSGKVSRAKAKWYEVEGANPFADGSTIQIVAGPGLIGRFAEVIRPSSKEKAIKAFLLKQTTGERQGTLITLDFENIEAKEFVPTALKVEPAPETSAAQEAAVASESKEDQNPSEDTSTESTESTQATQDEQAV